MLAATLITILTMTPGGDLFARFGHTAILVEDEAGARVYNFGAFKAGDPHIVSQFLHNAIPYYLAVNEVPLFEWKYRDRVVTGQKLALDDDEARRLAEKLAWTLRPENRNYRYDWFRSNCTTKTRDLIDEVIGGVWRAQRVGRPATVHPTIRSLMVDALWTVPSVATLFSLSINQRADVPLLDAWEELALPADLMRGLREARRPDGRPLLAEEWIWEGPAPRPAQQPRWLQPIFEGLLLCLLVWGALGKRVAGGLGLVAWGGLCALLSAWWIFWSIIPYPDGFATVNLLGYSPLAVLLIPAGIRLMRGRAPWKGSRRVIEIIAVTTCIELFLHLFGVGRQQHFRYTLYALLALALAWLTVRAADRAPRSP